MPQGVLRWDVQSSWRRRLPGFEPVWLAGIATAVRREKTTRKLRLGAPMRQLVIACADETLLALSVLEYMRKMNTTLCKIDGGVYR